MQADRGEPLGYAWGGASLPQGRPITGIKIKLKKDKKDKEKKKKDKDKDRKVTLHYVTTQRPHICENYKYGTVSFPCMVEAYIAMYSFTRQCLKN